MITETAIQVKHGVETDGVIYSVEKNTLTHITFIKNKGGSIVDIPKCIIDADGVKRKITKLKKGGLLFCSQGSYRMACDYEADITLNVPSTVKTISKLTFHKDNSISKIVLPDTITDIEEGAFAQSSLKEVPNWPANCPVIPSECFAYTKIKSFTVPQGVEKIEHRAFLGSSLETIDFSGCEFASIDTSVFENCPSLSKIILPYHFYVENSSSFEYNDVENVFYRTKSVASHPCISIEGHEFVITGTLSRVRADVEREIISRRGFVSNRVSSSTDYLIVGEKPGNTKLNAAAKHRTPQITEDDLWAAM